MFFRWKKGELLFYLLKKSTTQEKNEAKFTRENRATGELARLRAPTSSSFDAFRECSWLIEVSHWDCWAEPLSAQEKAPSRLSRRVFFEPFLCIMLMSLCQILHRNTCSAFSIRKKIISARHLPSWSGISVSLNCAIRRKASEQDARKGGQEGQVWWADTRFATFWKSSFWAVNNYFLLCNGLRGGGAGDLGAATDSQNNDRHVTAMRPRIDDVTGVMRRITRQALLERRLPENVFTPIWNLHFRAN